MDDHRYEDGIEGGAIQAWSVVFARQKAFAEHAFGQLDDAAFFAEIAPGMNSVAVIARHMGGNMLSRWTDFLTTDGEKPTRDRDAELEPFPAGMGADAMREARAGVMAVWEDGWRVLLGAIEGLTPADLGRTVTIRGAPHSVHVAVARQLDHYAFHVGQINVIARQLVGTGVWRWFTVEPGGTKAFNASMKRKHS